MRYEDLVKPGFLSIEDAKRTARDRRSFVLRERRKQFCQCIHCPVYQDSLKIAAVPPRPVELPLQVGERSLPDAGENLGYGEDVHVKHRFKRVGLVLGKFKLLFKGQWHRFLHRFVGTVDGKERPAREEEKTTPRRGRDQTGGA